MAIQQKKKRLIQFILLGVIIIISFSFLFIYAKQDNKKKPVGVSYIDHQPTLTSKHKDTEKKSSKEDDNIKEKDKKTTSNQQGKQEEKVTSNSEQKETENNKTSQKQSATQKNESVKKDEAPVKQPEIKTVTISIDMKNILNHKGEVDARFQKFIPADGVLLAPIHMEIQEGDTVYDMLTRACEQQGIPLDASGGYVKYINNIGEFDAGKSSGWLYTVNGELCSMGSTQYQVKPNDVIAWRYTVSVGDV